MYQYTNNAIGTLAGAVSPSATQIILDPGQYPLFPILAAPDTFYVTVVDAATQEQIEIMLVTATSTDVFTVSRGQQGTTARSWSANDIVSLRTTALQYADFLSKAYGGTVLSPLQVNSTFGATGATTLGATLAIAGATTCASTVTAAGFNATSDYRLKEDVQDIRHGAYIIEKLRPVSYIKHYAGAPQYFRRELGFLAHEVQTVVPSAVTGQHDGPVMQTVDYLQIIPALVSAVQALTLRVKELEGR